MLYFCCYEGRREKLRDRNDLNGIDFLEVDANQQKLYVHFCNSFFLSPSELSKNNLLIEGGERIRGIAIVGELSVSNNVLTVSVNKPGDFSTYTFRLVPTKDYPLDRLDPLLRSVDFSFKVNCPSDFDCHQPKICPSKPLVAPEIDYLAKDYASFRQLMLDRLAVLLPQWQERNPADLGIALVELLAYVGDRLSYQQDAIATEAYLATARRRTSVRRHARLVDYFLHDGCNARVWVQVCLDETVNPGPPVSLSQGTQLLTAIPQMEEQKRINPGSLEYDRALATNPVVFETMQEIPLFRKHNEMPFYTWGDTECCLPKGATKATLAGHYPHLHKGDVLIFEEVRGAISGIAADADPEHRHAVRLTKVVAQVKEGVENKPLKDILYDTDITEIQWSEEDALPFPLCISAQTKQGYKSQISIALGNIVLADHGRKISSEELDEVPESKLSRVGTASGDRCDPEEKKQILKQLQIPPRFRPQLKKKNLTHRYTLFKTIIKKGKKEEKILFFDPEAPASVAFEWSMKDVLPSITLKDSHDREWSPRRDLLASNALDKKFVVEMEEDGTAYLRFGDDRYGMRPNVETSFEATYRVGNGTEGNIGADTLTHIVTSDSRIFSIRNPLPAKRGVDPEPLEDVRQKAPAAFRTQERAVTPEDYAEVAERYPQLQKAASTFRWTGSWHTVFVTVDRLGGLPVTSEFEDKMRQHLEKYRMAGYDLEIDAPRPVSLEIEISVCVNSDYFRSHVKAALLEAFSDRILPNGQKGIFHPDNWTFGQSVYLSRLYETAQSVTGVDFVDITKFQRQGQPSEDAIEKGILTLGRLEIARLDNDPNFPERGVLHLIMGGGK